MMFCDFHVHSHFSDGRLSIPELVDLYGKRGFGAIAITDERHRDAIFQAIRKQEVDFAYFADRVPLLSLQAIEILIENHQRR